VCAVCSTPALSKCARCKSVSYCSPAHQKEDWKAHKTDCPRLAQEALAAVFKPCDEELLLRITTCLAQNGYHKEVGVMVQLNKAFWNDEQIWDAYKDYTPGPRGRTRLMYASVNGLLSRLKWLLARGARVNTDASRDGWTALMVACLNGRLEVVRELCERGANVNTAKTDDGFTALICASQGGHVQVVRELCARGANVNHASTPVGLTSLMKACQKGHLEIVLELCSRGADVNVAGTNGFTSLMLACQNSHLEVVRELCSRGACECSSVRK
jgi:hypothetical protein